MYYSDVHREAMENGRNPCESLSVGLEELSLKKQLPLRQQTIKPTLKYDTTMTKPLNPLDQGDSLLIRKDVMGVCTNPPNSFNTNGKVMPSHQPHKPENTSVLKPIPTQQNKQPLTRRKPCLSLNPYSRPVTAHEVRSVINGDCTDEQPKENTNATELSDPLFHRNYFLRPKSMSTLSNPERKRVSSIPDPLKNQGSPSPSNRHARKSALQAKFYFASTTAVVSSNTNIDKNLFIQKELRTAIPISSSIPMTNTDTQILHNSNQYGALINENNELPAELLKEESVVECKIPPNGTNTKALDNHSPAFTASENQNVKPDEEQRATSFFKNVKKVPVSNAMTSSFNFRNAFDHIRHSKANELVSGNINSSNISNHQPAALNYPNGHTPSLPFFDKNSRPASDKVLRVPRPLLERANASLQLEIKYSSSAKEKPSPAFTKNKVSESHLTNKNKPPTALTRSKVIESSTQSVKVVRKHLPLRVKLSKKTLPHTDKQNLKNILLQEKLAQVSDVKPAQVKVESRIIGDGAPVENKFVYEKFKTSREKIYNWDQISNGDDEDNIKDKLVNEESEMENESDTAEEGSESSPSGERLPGDGETSDDLGDEEELDNLEDNSSEVESEVFSVISTGSSGRSLAVRSQAQHERNENISLSSSNKLVIKPAFNYSLFHKIPPTLNFVSEGEKTEQLPYGLRKLLKWKMSPITPIVVRSAITRIGFKISRKNSDWLGCFGKHMKSQCFKLLRDYQKLNHFPGSFNIGRKDRLWKNLSRMQAHFGKKEFSFFPQTFVLPGDLKLLKRHWEESTGKQKWIIKPPASARGIGIRVISKWSQIPRKRPVIVQKYIHRPFLINDSKFDMRIYVYVSSFDPLRLYVYDDGLARFASCKYSSSSKTLNNRFMHLTNYSVNKKNVEYLSNSDNNLCEGHKWSLKSLWEYMKKLGINTNIIWDNIRDLIIKTIISGDSTINSMTKANAHNRYCCHELFGFDILLDENLKPWILEVNISPSLHSNSPLDVTVKSGMIRDLMNIAGYRLPDERDLRGNVSSDSSGYNPPNKFCMDKRLFTTQLSPDERAKHAYFCQKHQDELHILDLLSVTRNTIVEGFVLKQHKEIMQSILDTITPDDLRLLCESIDEDSRKGNFQRLFPTPQTHRYLRFFDQPRYYNLLLDQWVLRYNHMEERGILLLQSLCDESIHLHNPTTNPRHQWTPPHSFVANHVKSADTKSQNIKTSVVPLPRVHKKPARAVQETCSRTSSTSSLPVTSSSDGQISTPSR
ncbi:uncharacterized protein LOC131944866 isoform X2 [Physella acuta]|uniref:uncharacterized protein LOC131944866 isoform X2 n=1 Tax=Physella acuta TaxID=109671 RepID=UPI0027DAF2A1|nr:uncharacterized protein LOC131944866 isoform X2 [Physella acuta]